MSFSQIKTILDEEMGQQQPQGEPVQVGQEVDPDNEMFQRLLRDVKVDTSSLGALSMGLAESKTLFRNIGDLATVHADIESEEPSFLSSFVNRLGGRLMWRDLESGELTFPYVASPEELFGQDWQQLDNDQKRERIKQFDADQIDAYYGGVVETASPVAKAAGTLSGLLADPSTLLPVGATYANAAKIGAGIGATDATIHGLATEGKVDMNTVALGAVLGGTLGPVVKFAGDLIPAIRDKIRKKEPVSADDIIENSGISSKDVLALPGPSRGPIDPLDPTLPPGPAGPAGFPKPRPSSEGPADKVLTGEIIPRGQTFSRADAEKLANEINVQFGLSPQKLLTQDTKIAEKAISPTKNLKLKGEVNRSPDRALFDLRRAAASQEGLSEAEVQKLVELDKSYKDQYGDYFFGEKNPEWKTPGLAYKTKYNPLTENSELPADYKPKYYGRTKELDPSVLALPPKSEQSIIDDVVLDRVNKQQADLTENFREYVRKSAQSGEAAQWLVRDLAAASAGGLYGYSQEGDWESAAMWAIASAGGMHAAGVLGPKLYNAVGKMTPPTAEVTEEIADSWARKYLAHRFGQRPSEFFKNIAGVTGHRFSELLQRLDEDVRSLTARDFIDIKKFRESAGIQKGTDAYRQVVQVLRNPELMKNASKPVRETAIYVRKKLNSVVEQAVQRGVLSREEAEEMLRKAVSEGYFPRVYDNFFLASKEGEKKWYEVFSNHTWSKAQIDIATRSILGQKGGYSTVNFKAKRDSKTGEVLYTVDKEFIRKLYRARNKATFTSRSAHLEKDRKIGLPDEVLDPFLVNDLDNVLVHYFQDTYKRISGARYFGRNDEVMHELVNEMKHRGMTATEINDAWTVFKTAVSDPSSPIIQKMMDMTPELRRFYSVAASLQTFRLIFAQTLGSTQALANSLVYLPSRVGASTPKVILKGITNTFSKENREWAERTGAAFETTIMEVAGEMGALENRYATKFLEYTGFTFVEKLQRTLAANLGKAYAEELLSRKAALIAKRTNRKLGKDGIKELENVDRLLHDMGIDTRVPPSKVSAVEMDRAALRYSNTVNFVNTPEKLPLYWQDPRVKLFRQFKTFIFHQSAFLNDNLVKPMKRGDWRPVFGLAAAGGLGMSVSELRKFLKGDDEDYTLFQRYLQGFTAIGGLGIAWDLAQQAVYGPGAIAQWALGPTVGTVADVLSGAAKSAEKGSIDPLARATIGLPIVGQALDVSGSIKNTAEAVGYPLDFLPTRKDLKEEFSSRKKGNPYEYYNNIYK